MLSGLKSAFFTSIFGIILSLIFAKINRRLFFKRKVNEPKSIEYDVLNKIYDTLTTIKQENIKQNASLENDRNGIQIQTKETKRVSENIQNFAETLGKHNAQAITDALQEIIEDFNDTFKKLYNIQ